ncbi:IS1595 family transposase [Bacteroides thetaiotaomicron]|uniref:IS1595 family transposase n=1 Tax=Bacteroides thetaiotaomicron TaxID=818 RepID=UPI00232FB925|nr:IS1595 family transposase [Bacteroides thetaiotaomicron]MDC2244960.1 IS1595 family transposase [Bacteroides thetaiotaomicron]
MKERRKRKSIVDFKSSFPDEESAIKFYERIRWYNGVISPFDPTSKVYKCKNGRYKCKNTGKYFTYRTGTYFANSKLGMRDWLYAIIMLANHKKGISSYQLANDLDIPQKTAWYMIHRIRASMAKENNHKLSGEVEIDESFVSGKNKNRHKDKKVEKCQGRSYKDKVSVFGILERGGKMFAKVVPNTQARTLVSIVKKNVDVGSIIYTDGWSYKGLEKKYTQMSVDHGKHFYGTTFVTDDGEIIQVTTNRIENAWSVFKRTIKGTYIHVSKKHLQRYVDEFVFRFNTRKISKNERFELLLRYAA